jgi:environmental stress-induced protein Ves
MDAVMLSVAKHLWPELQILRFAQDDNSSASVCQRTSQEMNIQRRRRTMNYRLHMRLDSIRGRSRNRPVVR